MIPMAARTWAARLATALRIPGALGRMLGRRRRRAAPGGVSLLGYIRAETGMGEAARSSARALQAAGIPFDIVKLDTGTTSLERDMTWVQREVAAPAHGILLVQVNADSTTRVLGSLPREFLRGRYVIAHWTWELPAFPDAWRGAFDCVDEVWVPSRFVQAAVSARSPVPVTRIPYCVGVDAAASVKRGRFNLPEGRFLFLTMFDSMSYMPRKNPGAVLAAFERAFAGAADGPGLVIKINRPRGPLPPAFHGAQIEMLLARARAVPNVYVIDEVLTRADVNALVSLCDCFVSLHRSEGFGLGGAEACALGKPVIQTAWSGNTDYMPVGTPGAVACRLVPVGGDVGPYAADQFWAEPDLDDAAQWMLRISTDGELALAAADAGRRRIAAEFSPAAAGLLMTRRLRAFTA